MSSKKRNKKNNYNYNEDIEDIRGKGTKKNKKKARRHDDKNYLKRFKDNDYNEDELDNYMDYNQ
jgi:hypothetical protein